MAPATAASEPAIATRPSEPGPLPPAAPPAADAAPPAGEPGPNRAAVPATPPLDRERIEREARAWAAAERARQAEQRSRPPRPAPVPAAQRPTAAGVPGAQASPPATAAIPPTDTQPQAPAPAAPQLSGVAEKCGGTNPVAEQFCVLAECIKPSMRKDPVCVRRAQEAAEARREQSP